MSSSGIARFSRKPPPCSKTIEDGVKNAATTVQDGTVDETALPDHDDVDDITRWNVEDSDGCFDGFDPVETVWDKNDEDFGMPDSFSIETEHEQATEAPTISTQQGKPGISIFANRRSAPQKASAAPKSHTVAASANTPVSILGLNNPYSRLSYTKNAIEKDISPEDLEDPFAEDVAGQLPMKTPATSLGNQTKIDKHHHFDTSSAYTTLAMPFAKAHHSSQFRTPSVHEVRVNDARTDGPQSKNIHKRHEINTPTSAINRNTSNLVQRPMVSPDTGLDDNIHGGTHPSLTLEPASPPQAVTAADGTADSQEEKDDAVLINTVAQESDAVMETARENFDNVHKNFLESIRDFQDDEKKYTKAILDMNVLLDTSHAEMLATQVQVFDLIDRMEKIKAISRGKPSETRT